jgi:ATP-dependent Clp protease ATP-binding subunit ClpC
MFLGDGDIEGKIRSEIKQRITQKERIPTSVEIPLTTDCKKVLNLASDEAQRFRHRRVGTEHVLVGMLGVEGSLAARMLQSWGLRLEAVRDKVAKEFRSNVDVGEGHGKVLV